MKKTDIPQRIMVPAPIASASGSAYTPIETASSGNLNFIDGFPSAYSAPASANGKYIKRGEMNAIGRIASQTEFFDSIGSLKTFDSQFCSAVGGYPEGAVLWFINGGTIRPVISLKDDNEYDFTVNGIDGVNWKYATGTSDSTAFPDYDRRSATSLFGLIESAPAIKGQWSQITPWISAPYDGWERTLFYIAGSSSNGVNIRLCVGNSSGDTPDVDLSRWNTEPYMWQLDRTLNYDTFDVLWRGDITSSMTPIAKNSKVALFCYMNSDYTPSTWKINDLFYAPATR